jgi:N-methylhydantoinase B
LGALAKALPDHVPAASYGTMNNVAMGSASADATDKWSYYETIAGGAGASARAHGLNGVQCHMTNTLNTPVESLELHYPMRIKQYALRDNSNGAGRHCGGMGIIRQYEMLQPTSVTLLTERRYNVPWGIAGGETAQCGINRVNDRVIGAKTELTLKNGDILTVETPGGGGWGENLD